MTVSVLIATFNRAELLRECLDHLSRQTFIDGDELIVVDNGSTDDTASVVAAAASRFSIPVKYAFEPEPGKSHALACGLELVRGDVVALTDDDVNVQDNWVDAIRHRMENPAIALMGGAVLPRWEHVPPKWLRQACAGNGRISAPLALLNYGDELLELGPRGVVGANMAVRRDVLTRLGGFALHLGKLRGTLLSGEDHDLCLRVQAAGFRTVYDPAARVEHRVPADRMRVRYYLSWFFWSGITHAALEANAALGRSVLGVPLYLFRRAAASGVAAAAFTVGGNLEGAVDRLTDVAFAAGYTARRWTRGNHA